MNNQKANFGGKMNIRWSLLSTAVLALTSPSFALHELNCSTATGSFRRVEKEIWGVNAVSYFVNGTEVVVDELVIQTKPRSKRVLASTNSVGYKAETYVEKVTVSRKNGSALPSSEGRDIGQMKLVDWSLCHSWWNSALD